MYLNLHFLHILLHFLYIYTFYFIFYTYLICLHICNLLNAWLEIACIYCICNSKYIDKLKWNLYLSLKLKFLIINIMSKFIHKLSEVAESCPSLCDPKACRLLNPWNFPGKSTGVGCHFLLQGIFPTQRSNLHCGHMLNHLSYQGSPIYT